MSVDPKKVIQSIELRVKMLRSLDPKDLEAFIEFETQHPSKIPFDPDSTRVAYETIFKNPDQVRRLASSLEVALRAVLDSKSKD